MKIHLHEKIRSINLYLRINTAETLVIEKLFSWSLK